MDNSFSLSPDHELFVARMIASGRFDQPSAVIARALDLMARAESDRIARLSALHSALAEETEAADSEPTRHEQTWHEQTWSEIERLMADHLPVLRQLAEKPPAPAPLAVAS